MREPEYNAEGLRVLRIDPDRWLRGSGSDGFLVHYDGCGCLLGLHALEMGVPPEDVWGRCSPSEVIVESDWKKMWHEEGVSWMRRDSLNVGCINDTVCAGPMSYAGEVYATLASLDDEARIAAAEPFFRKRGWTLVLDRKEGVRCD